ncbi:MULTISPECIES: acyltransferase [unclassified Phycicoccus]|uniref:acyltransferase family protein n=1 Tax=unclassified Phycicoccus TaxID=2637926 RepID=UPI00070258E5|nr:MULTISPECIES: acyltransferase [unclassified Phycicoccus]KRF22693.1 hypothetical protein ASG91_14890 [Phycicoccus sp. Soil802]KRF24625.1 hypothetical protein ASG95_08935 [Phycicoccus sp. Soil803]
MIVSHSFSLLGHPEPIYAGVPLGGWAVAGFFTISGYLIPRARLHTDLGTFLLRRARRIYPAFWACCAIIALIASPIAAHLTGATYLPRAALTYVVTNASTFITQQTIGDETAGAPAGLVMWNGPAWTLVFELLCYLIAGSTLTLATARRHQTTVALATYAIATTSAITTDNQHGLGWFVALFAAGWVISTRADHIRPTRGTTRIALAFAVAMAMVHPALAAIPLAYAILAGGALLPVRQFRTNDISYGTYLYGWPTQQLLIVLGVDAQGIGIFLPVAVGVAMFAGTASWFLLERRLLPRRAQVVAAPAASQALNQLV